jgi:hypothetical protein
MTRGQRENRERASGGNAGGALTCATAEPGPARSRARSTPPLARVGVALGGVAFLYGAVTATLRYGHTPWALAGAYVAAVVALVKLMVELVPNWPDTIPQGTSHAARIGATAARWLDRGGGPAALLEPALAIPCAAFAGYGLIHLLA